MKLFFIGFILLGISVSWAMACDICGCSIQGGAFGVLPQYHTHFVGIRAQSTRYRYPSYATQDRFFQTELWGRFYPINRLQVVASLPYRFNQRIDETSSHTLHGLGDASILLNLSIYATPDTLKQKIYHNLFIGGGIKMPTAQLNQEKTEDLPANFQLGTGSWDGLLALQYQARIRNWGLNPQLSYKRNTENQDAYRFGDQLSVATYLYHWTSGIWWMWMPYAGVSTEWIARDVNHGFYQDNTGGQGIFAVVGSEFYTKHWSLGASYQLPLQQRYAGGEIEAGSRMNLQFSILF